MLLWPVQTDCVVSYWGERLHTDTDPTAGVSNGNHSKGGFPLLHKRGNVQRHKETHSFPACQKTTNYKHFCTELNNTLKLWLCTSVNPIDHYTSAQWPLATSHVTMKICFRPLFQPNQWNIKTQFIKIQSGVSTCCGNGFSYYNTNEFTTLIVTLLNVEPLFNSHID